MLGITVALQGVVLTSLQRSRERLARQDGQASVEYVGVVIAAAILVLVIITAATGFGGQLVSGIQRKITEIISK